MTSIIHTSIKLTGLKKSPTHLAMMSDKIIGILKVMSPIHSIIITAKLMVMRTVPPNPHAAPIRAYFPTFVP